MPKAVAPSPLASPQPLSGGVSILEKDGARTRWIHVDLPAGTRQVVATFPGSCGSVAFSRDGRHALVSCDGGYRSVNLDPGRIDSLPPAPNEGGVQEPRRPGVEEDRRRLLAGHGCEACFRKIGAVNLSSGRLT